jgi:hypothetical protein
VLPEVGIGEPVGDEQCDREYQHAEQQSRRRVRERQRLGAPACGSNCLHSPSYFE